MRLLSTFGDQPTLFNNVDEEHTHYAILSHRWLADEQEVTFDDIQNGRGQEKQGWFKLMACRQQALMDKYNYIWLDTCCIDKSSSQELSEAINAMYRWYERAGVCYVYLHQMPDLPTNSDPLLTVDVSSREFASQLTAGHTRRLRTQRDRLLRRQMYLDDDSIVRYRLQKPWNSDDFRACDWFTRGWTLQEMIASRNVEFYSKSWDFIAHLQDVVDDVVDITNIHRDALTGKRPIRLYSVAQRMSWAATRKVTKIEDQAYSLMGIMDVNMNVIYGEGKKAFQRLQEILLREVNDDSIFVHGNLPSLTGAPQNNAELQHALQSSELSPGPLFAESPEEFRGSHDIKQLRGKDSACSQVAGREITLDTQVFDRTAADHPLLLPFRSVLYDSPTIFRIVRTALLRCCLEDDMSIIIGLNLYSLPGSEDQFFVNGERPFTLINIFDPLKALGKQSEARFSILRTYDILSNADGKRYRTVICKGLSRRIEIMPPDPFFDGRQSWARNSLTLNVRMRTFANHPEDFRSHVSVTVRDGDSPPATLHMSMGQYRFDMSMRFENSMDHFGSWTFQDDGREIGRAAIFTQPSMDARWFQRQCLLARALLPSTRFGYQNAVLLEISSHSFLSGICRSAWYATFISTSPVYRVFLKLSMLAMPYLIFFIWPLYLITHPERYGIELSRGTGQVLFWLSVGTGFPIATYFAATCYVFLRSRARKRHSVELALR